MPERYRDILAQCLAHEDKAHRDRVLARQPDHVAAMVRGALLIGLAHRHCAWIRYAGAGVRVHEGPYEYRPMTAEERRALRRDRLAAIEPAWLRRRVETMVRERFDYVRHQQEQLRMALEDSR